MMAVDDYKNFLAKLSEDRQSGTLTYKQASEKIGEKLASLSPEDKKAVTRAHFNSPPYDPRFPNQNQTR